MNADIIKGKWKEFKGKLKEKWGDITDDELLQIEGNSDKIYGVLQQRYGLGRDEAKKTLDELSKDL
ncbi:MAG: CsbD family protein [Burkholderiales bacterium]|nr:CsbD family protein [Burkholderiales bacterium]